MYTLTSNSGLWQQVLDEVEGDARVGEVLTPAQLSSLIEDARRSPSIGRAHAEWLFAIHRFFLRRGGAPTGWDAVFPRLICGHLLGPRQEACDLPLGEAQWLRNQVALDGETDRVELQLLALVSAAAVDAPCCFKNYVLDEIESFVVREGKVTAEGLEWLHRVVFGTAGFCSVGVGRPEADMLFRINAATAGAANAPEWKDFFVGAIRAHLLHDSDSPGEVDEEEAGWLAEQIRQSPAQDENTRVLLRALQAHARRLPRILRMEAEELRCALTSVPPL